MLEKQYDNVLYGMNYISLIYGIISLEKKQTCLIIDNESFSKTSNWLRNIGELDRLVLKSVGKSYGISLFENLDKYIEPTNNLIFFNDICVELSASPYLNLKELMRKFPIEFREGFIPFLEKYNQEDFDKEFNTFVESLAISKKNQGPSSLLSSYSTELMNDLFQSYEKFISKDFDFVKQFNHVLQVMFQVKFTPNIENKDSQFLFLQLLSPRFSITVKKLQEELLFHFKRLGGDIKTTTISDWGLDKKKLKFITLDSVDGAIELRDSYFFGNIDENFPFLSSFEGNQYLSINFECILDNDFINFYSGKRIIYSDKNRIGSDFPFWELRFDGNHVTGSYAYIEKQGSKANFYYHQIVDDVFQFLKEILPGLLKVDWVSRVRLYPGDDIWFERMKGLEKDEFIEKSNLVDLRKNKNIEGVKHYGPKSSD